MDSETRFYSFSVAFMILFSLILQYPPIQTFAPSNSTSANSISNSIVFQNTAFIQNGLPQNTLWSVSYNSNSLSALSQNQIYFNTTSGMYYFSIQPVPYNNVTLTPSPLSGNLNSGSMEHIDFTLPTNFKESGLPAGVNWGVLYYNVQNTSSSNSTKIFLHYGLYSYLYSNVVINGIKYVPLPSSGFLQTGSSTNAVYLALNSTPVTTTISTSSTSSTTSSTSTSSLSTTSSTSTLSTSTSTILPSNSTLNSTTTSSTTSSTTSTTSSSSTTTAPKLAGAKINGTVEGSLAARTKTLVTVANFSDTHLSVKGSTFSDVRIGFSKAVSRFNISVVDQPAPITGIAARPKNNVFQYIQINESNSNNTGSIDPSVANVTYNFTVPITWMASQGISNGNVRLMKFVPSQNSWDALPTTYTGSNITNYFFSAASNSLSAYAVSYATGNAVGASVTSLTLDIIGSSYTTYFYSSASGLGGKSAVVPISSAGYTNTVNAINSVLLATAGYSTSNSVTTTTTATSNIVIAGIGANVLIPTGSNTPNGGTVTFSTNVAKSNTLALSFTVAQANSFVVLLSASSNILLNTITKPTGCTTAFTQNVAYNTGASAVAIACNSVAAGTITFTVQNTLASRPNTGILATAYVFPPYALTLNDLPTTGNILTIPTGGAAGVTFAHNSVLNMIGDGTINAIAPQSGGTSWTFNGWTVSNSVNGIIASPLSKNTFFTLLGNTIVQAGWFEPLLLANGGSPGATSVSNSVIDVGQYSTLNTIIGNGIAPYVGNWVWTVPGTNVLTANSRTNTLTANILLGGIVNSALTVNAYQATNVLFTYNSVGYNANILGVNTVYGSWSFNENYFDHAANQVTPASLSLTINSALIVGYSAVNVLGQGSFTTNAVVASTTQNSLFLPRRPDFDISGNIFVPDSGNNRILEFNSPFTNNEGAGIVIGQSGFTANTGADTAAGLINPYTVRIDSNGNLWVADFGNNRVLKYPTPLSTGESATVAIGQSGLTSNTGLLTQNGLISPIAMEFDPSGNLWVTDAANNRVLKYPTPFVSNEGATVSIGQGSFTTNAGLLTQNGLIFPKGVNFDPSGNLWVTDFGNNRVLEYDTPFTSNEGANIIIGQTSYTVNTALATNNGLSGPSSISFDNANNLWVVDSNNNRVLEFLSPFSTGEVASLVLGQNSLSPSGGPTSVGATTQQNFVGPKGMAFNSNGNFLVVGDEQNNRLLTFSSSGNSIISSNWFAAQGQAELLTASFAGGSSSYTYNYYLTNSINGNVIANMLVSNTVSSNTFSFSLPTGTNNALGPLDLALTITDSATTPFKISTTNTITVTSIKYNSYFAAIGLPIGASWNVVYDGILTAQTIANSIAGAWTNLGSSPSVGNAYPENVENEGCAQYNGNIYCIGGANPTLGNNNDVEQTQILGSNIIKSWTQQQLYPENIINPVCIPSNIGNIYCIGGESTGSLYVSDVYWAPISSATNALGSWTSTTAYPVNILTQDCRFYNGNIYCVGGQANTFVDQALVYYAPIVTTTNALGAWINTNSYPQTIEGLQCPVYNGYIYCVDGYNGVGYDKQAYYAPIFSTNIVGAWVNTNSIPYNGEYGQCTIDSGNIFCKSGYQGSRPQNSLYFAPILNPGIGAWSSNGVGNIFTNDTSMSCPDPWRDNWYCIGGSTLFASTNTIYYAPLILNNRITFNVPAGSYSFIANAVTFLGNLFNPTPSSGTLVAGDPKSNALSGTGNTATIGYTISSTCTLSLSNTVVLFSGSANDVIPGSSGSPTNAVTDTNAGTQSSYLWVYGSNWFASPATTNFFVSNTLFSNSFGNTGAGYLANSLGLSTSNSGMLVTTTTPNTLFLGVNIPTAETSAYFSQNVVFLNVC
ncbi:MAG: PGF-pre-PGF domain-containing protein [Candidatus Micrarchaeota archaeon]|nr:PGF-pre-PGF domain-containing protein [Candidatus Micrarchaeota archaeon]